MNLVIDVGNSTIKIAAVEKDEVVELLRTKSWDAEPVRLFLSKYKKFEKGIVSTVRDEPIPLWIGDYVEKKLLHFTHKTPVPIKQNYDTPDTLGLDRLAAAVGANNIYPNSNVLVVDCGTAITLDVVSSSGTFEGGNISLGVRSRFRALAAFTAKLPQVEITDKFPLIGKNTKDAIAAGVLNGVLFEMNSYFDVLKPIYPGLKVLFTGGDAFFFDGKLKNRIFVVPNLVVLGLNRILEHNV